MITLGKRIIIQIETNYSQLLRFLDKVIFEFELDVKNYKFGYKYANVSFFFKIIDIILIQVWVKF